MEVKYGWETQITDNSLVGNLAKQLNISEVVAKFLVSRGLKVLNQRKIILDQVGTIFTMVC